MKKTVLIRDVWMDYSGWINELCSKFKDETGIEVTPNQLLDDSYKEVEIVKRDIRDCWGGDIYADYTIEYEVKRVV